MTISQQNSQDVPQGSASQRIVRSQLNVACLGESTSKCTYDSHRLHAVEHYPAGSNLVVGALVCHGSSHQISEQFHAWFEEFVVLRTTFRPAQQVSVTAEPDALKISETVADVFEKTLRNISSQDKWPSQGREYFINRVYGYVQRDARIELGLPAFPCKSPNKRKVSGSDPDMAERIAFHVLRDFVAKVTQVYPTGATLWIISDGHVFSDCSESFVFRIILFN